MCLDSLEMGRPDRQGVWRYRTTDVIVSGALDNQSYIVVSSEPHAKLDVVCGRGVYDEDRISLTAAWITRFRKTGVIVVLVPHAGDGVALVEVVGGPTGLDVWTCCGVVGWLSGMADSSWRRRLEQSAPS